MTTIDELMDKMKAMCDTMSAEDFERRLEGWTLIYGYMEKRFEQRFPEQFKAYVDRIEK